MMRLLCTPYDPDVLDSFPATAPEVTHWLTSGEMRVGSWCEGGTQFKWHLEPRHWSGRVVGFRLYDYNSWPVARLYVEFFDFSFENSVSGYIGPSGIPVDQFVFVG